jgi:hypothetical protein
MSDLLKQLLAEAREEQVEKIAEAPNEAPSTEQQNADVLETSQAMISKIDNFIQQATGGGGNTAGQVEGQTEATGGQVDGGAVSTTGDPNDPTQAGNATVKLEVPAGMTVKLGSCDPVNSDTAIRTIISLMPSYFGE